MAAPSLFHWRDRHIVSERPPIELEIDRFCRTTALFFLEPSKTDRVSQSSNRCRKGVRDMKTQIFAAALVAASAIAPLAHAGDAKVTGMAGGAATGAVLGGPVGAVVGGAVGLTTGAAIDDSNKKTVIIKKQQPAVVVHEHDDPDVVIHE
jgi:hypothetical protein